MSTSKVCARPGALEEFEVFLQDESILRQDVLRRSGCGGHALGMERKSSRSFHREIGVTARPREAGAVLVLHFAEQFFALLHGGTPERDCYLFSLEKKDLYTYL